MTLIQGIELAKLAKAKGYVLAAHAGKVQAQILDADGNVATEITPWVGYTEALQLLK